MKFLTLLTLFSSQLVVFGQQHQIDWGTSAVTDKVITSDGSPITLAEFSIELGGFGGGFIPTGSNVEQWVANWQVFDAVTDPDSDINGPRDPSGNPTSADNFVADAADPINARFSGTGFLQADNTSSSEDSNGIDTFGPNQQAYVFIRNSDTTDENAEWLLYTSETGEDWEFPTVVGSQPDIPDTWFLGEADNAIYGAVNGTIVGDGLHSDNSSDFILRTHTFVPEPSSAALFLLGALSLLRRRR